MIEVRRVLAVGAVVSLATIVTCTHRLGRPQGRRQGSRRGSAQGNKPGDKIDRQFAEEFNFNRFGDRPLIVYTTKDGTTLAALQIKPELDPAPVRPRDVLVLVRHLGQQGPGAARLRASRSSRQLAGKLGKEDRVAIWTVNTNPKKLTKGFVPTAELADAFKTLAKEFPAGATNLKHGLPKAINSFDDLEGQQRMLVFLGDGKSIAGPVDADDRAKLCDEMVERQIAFYRRVPLGDSPDPVNLHGFVNATGGKVVRLLNEARPTRRSPACSSAFDAPILYPQKLQLPDVVAEMMPTKLPPLRSDTATLLLCKVASRRPVSTTPSPAPSPARR